MTSERTAGERIFDEDFFADPYKQYAKIHAEGCPVRRVETPEGVPAWFVTEHEAVRSGLKDQRLSRRLAHAGPEYRRAPYPVEFLANSVVTEDPPEHTRLRRMLNQAFSPRSIRTLRPRIEKLAEELVDRISENIERDGSADLVADLAVPLPITVIAELLGVPLDRRAEFRRWGDGMLSLVPEEQAESGAAMLAFLTELIRAKAAEPGDDMLSYWISTRDEDGGLLEPKEVIGLAMVMLVGGYDTSVGMIAATLLGLLADQEKFAELMDDPSLLPDVVEEFLRLYGTVHTGVRRFATEPITLAGQEIAQGDTVLLSIAAADRDPERYPAPDAVDFGRPSNRAHLAFGMGPHVCPGNELARMEISIAVETLLRRMKGLRLTVEPDEIPWRRAYFIRIPLRLPVTLTTHEGGEDD
ncbi:cytochrome P450 [Streptomyces sp. NPDC006923]|uniref:cytochrome P450 family protein n=1 Tax=Streptomyces sp. NPDC006923 TaxID=3155355 RepID=UPI0033F473D3